MSMHHRCTISWPGECGTVILGLLLRKWVECARRLFFSAPRLTGPRRHALPVLIPGRFKHRSSSPRPAWPDSAVSACRCGDIGCCCFRMLVRKPVHGMQGPWERQKFEALFKLRTSLERTYAFLGYPSWPKAASRRAMRTV